MRLLLFFVSFIFSFIFYNFYLLSNWLNIFWDSTFYNLEVKSIFWNLLIESVFFIMIWIIFILSFTSYDEKNKWLDYKKIIYMIFYIFLLFPFYFKFFEVNNTIFIFVIMFIFWDISFKYISNIKHFQNQKINLRYFGLILNYLVFISANAYFYIVDFSYFLASIIIYSIVFNFNVHKNYTNYISLFLSIISSLFLIYYLFLKIKEIYIVLI